MVHLREDVHAFFRQNLKTAQSIHEMGKYARGITNKGSRGECQDRVARKRMPVIGQHVMRNVVHALTEKGNLVSREKGTMKLDTFSKAREVYKHDRGDSI